MAVTHSPAWLPTAHPPVDACDLFQFHPRVCNPELWRTTVPLVVRVRCGRHKGLIATWTAIHWLIVLYAASGRCAFGMREIAQEAGVGRNELAGPKGYIQRLVDFGLLRIVGYEPVPGVKEPRPIYHIDLAELERASLDLVPALLRDRRLPAPPRPAPDPRQLALFGADEPAHSSNNTVHENGTGGQLLTGASLVSGQATHESGTGAMVPAEASTHGNGTVVPAYRSRPRVHRPKGHQNERTVHENGTGSAAYQQAPALPGASMHETGTVLPANYEGQAPTGAGMHETGTGMLGSEPDRARNRDVDGWNEKKEREREIPRAHDFQQIVAAAAQAVFLAFQQQGVMLPAPVAAPGTPTSIEQPPHAPTGAPPLRASVVELWRGDREHVSQRELNQLTVIADSYDQATGGFGAYWLGRAIILADMCLSEHGRPLNLTYVRSMLRRWQQEGSWGSDLPCEGAGEASPRSRLRLPGVQTPRVAPVMPLAPPAGAPAPAPAAVPVTGDAEHPAIAAYKAAFGRELNPVQAEEIARSVTDLATWQQVLRDWQLEDWKTGGVGKMLDRYQKKLPGAVPAASERAPSVRVIHTYPGLDLDQREPWIRRFHAATTPAEKRAVIARLEQEHPR